MLTQNMSLSPSARDRRSAVSAVMARLPCTILERLRVIEEALVE